jgi:polar amino acid transport system substrate-binding protein
MRIIKYLSLFLILTSTPIFANETIEVCTDNSDWAPFTYYERNSNGEKSNKFTGASVDALKAISKKTGIKFNISAYPWKRCLSYVEHYGKVKKFEAFIDGTSNKSREEKYLKTEPFYATTLGVFYSKTRFPKGLDISLRKDLAPYKVCGIHGQNYDKYVKLGIKLDTGSKNISSAIKKVLAGRCDVYVSSLEPVLGDILLGNVEMPENLTYTQIKEKESNNFYFWISKQSLRAKEIKTTMDKAIKELKKDGKWEEIYKNYIPTGSGL